MQDFGSIFSTLLPGTNARLSPPEGMGILDGLEVNVAFGGIWKESLQDFKNFLGDRGTHIMCICELTYA